MPKPYRGSVRRKVAFFTDPAPAMPNPFLQSRYASKAALVTIALPSTERRALESRRYGVGGRAAGFGEGRGIFSSVSSGFTVWEGGRSTRLGSRIKIEQIIFKPQNNFRHSPKLHYSMLRRRETK